MTVELAPDRLSARLRDQFAGLDLEVGPNWLMFDAARTLEICRFLRDDRELDFAYLTCLTCVDRLEYFEVVYLLQSLRRNHLAVVKARLTERDDPHMPSVTSLWQGAHLQEDEVYDLFGIRFDGHPNLRRLFLWDGFAGWPLRKDFLQVGQGAFNPGLPHFPKEGGDRGVLSGPNWTAPSRETRG